MLHKNQTTPDKNPQYLLIVILMFTLLLQIIFSLYHFNKQFFSSYSYLKSSVINNQITSDELLAENLSIIAANVSNDAGVLSILSAETDYLDRAMTFNTLRNNIALISEISTVYLYSSKQQMLYSTSNSTYTLENFPVPEIQEELRKPRTDRKSTIIYNSQNENIRLNRTRYFLIYSVSFTAEDAIIIELNYEKLRQQYSKCQKALNGQFLVYFDDGSALFGGNDFTAGSIIEDAQITYFEKERSNNQVISYNGERYIISHYYSEYLDRNYVFMTPYSNLYTDKVLFKQYIYLSVGIIIYAVLMILALLLFRQIKLHIKLIKAGRSFHSQEQPDDTACLMDYMLNPNEDNTYKLKSYFPELLQTNCIFCISVLIEDDETFRKTYTQSDQKLLLFAFDNIIKEIFSNHSFGLYPIVQSEKNLIYIANYKGTDDITSHYQQAADRSIREILNYLNIQTSFYMSAQYPLNEMHIAYKDTRTLMQYSFIYKSGCILNADIIPQDEELFHEANLLYKQLKCCLETNNMQYKANMEALFTVLPRLQVNHIQDLLVQLLVYINEFSTKSSSTKNIISPLEVLHDLLAGEKNLDNILDYLSINIDAMILLQNEPPSNNLLLMIDKCKLIIDQEYADPSLCVEKIAERLGFSANYLGRKFKEYEGVSIAETLKSKRLDIAGEMIINTNYAIIDIINKSGFISPSHFNTAFKSKYGCTPSAYRIRNTQVTPKNE